MNKPSKARTSTTVASGDVCAGWKVALLDQIAKRGSGHTPNKGYPEYWNGGIKWISLADSRRLDKGLVTESDKEISLAGVRNSSAVIHPAGTVILSRDAGVGKSGVLAQAMAVSQHFIAWDCTASTELHNWYLYHWLQQQKPEFERMAVGSTIKTIGLPYFKKLKIMLPAFEEQLRMASILSTWDQAIATSERLLENSRSQWHALVSKSLHMPTANPDWLKSEDNGGFPASVQAGIPLLPSAPSGWRRVQLREHLTEVRRPVDLKDEDTYTLVTVKRSRAGVVLRNVLRGSAVKTATQFHVRSGDFLISKRQIVHGACGIVPPELDGAVVSNEYAVLNTDGEIDLKFLRYLSETRYFQQTCFHSSIGVHVEKMLFKTDHWCRWPFNIPSLEQQRRIVEILDTAGRELDALSRQVNTLKREKAALMSQILTGKRRVKRREAEMETQT
jgi:type I restriction enzyme S subunit